jgi:hypothetical protein
VSYSTESGRQQILDDAGAAVDPLASAIAAIGELYDQLDEQTAERMELIVFKPLQSGYGLLRRTLTAFADRSGLAAPEFGPPQVNTPSSARTALERVAGWVEEADGLIAELQDSLLPVEVGDQELRAGLSGTRTQVATVPGACADLLRSLGR